MSDSTDPVDRVQELLDRIAADRTTRAARLEDSTRRTLREFRARIDAWCAANDARTDANRAEDDAWRAAESARLAGEADRCAAADAVQARIAAALEGILAHLRVRP